MYFICVVFCALCCDCVSLRYSVRSFLKHFLFFFFNFIFVKPNWRSLIYSIPMNSKLFLFFHFLFTKFHTYNNFIFFFFIWGIIICIIICECIFASWREKKIIKKIFIRKQLIYYYLFQVNGFKRISFCDRVYDDFSLFSLCGSIIAVFHFLFRSSAHTFRRIFFRFFVFLIFFFLFSQSFQYVRRFTGK